MKPKCLVIVLLSVLMVVTVWGLLRKRPIKPPADSPQAVAESHAEGVPHQAEGQPPFMSSDDTQDTQDIRKHLEEMAKSRGVPLNVLTQEALLQVSKIAREMTAAVNRHVDFYGKVVDENEVPVQGATVKFGCLVFPTSQILTNVLTDAQGTFALGSLTGAILTVQVNMKGYEEAPGTNQNSFTYYSPLPTGGFRPDPNSPVIFLLRKKAQ